MSSVVELSKAQFQDLKFAPNKSTSDKIFMKLYYNKKPFLFKIPKVKIPFDSQKNNYGQIEVCVSVPAELAEYFKKMDTAIEELLKKEKPGAQYEFMTSLKQSNPSFDPLFKFKIFNAQGKYPALFDADKKPITTLTDNDMLLHLKKRTQAIFAIECSGLWIREGKCGVSFKLVQGRVFDSENTPQDDDYAFDDSDSSIEECLFQD